MAHPVPEAYPAREAVPWNPQRPVCASYMLSQTHCFMELQTQPFTPQFAAVPLQPCFAKVQTQSGLLPWGITPECWCSYLGSAHGLRLTTQACFGSVMVDWFALGIASRKLHGTL
jgi:hypothetical protein